MSLLKCARWAPRLPHRFPRPLVAARYSSDLSDLPGWDPKLNGMLDEEPDEDAPPPTGDAYDEPNPPAPRQSADMPPMFPRGEKTDPVYNLFVKATSNNTIVTFTRPTGHVVRTFTGGSVGFKSKNRATMEAGHQCAMSAFKAVRAMMEHTGGRMAVQLYVSGFGHGREAMVKALGTQEADDVRKLILGVTDKTPIKIGGTRAMKERRH